MFDPQWHGSAVTIESVFTNAQVVSPQEVFLGSVGIENGRIISIDRGDTGISRRIDLEGDYLIPGLLEMHTDNLEKHLVPRPGVEWPSALSALLSHDAQVIGAGITTVLDSVCVGEYEPNQRRREMLDKSMAAIHLARDKEFLRADHLLHLRCEYPDAKVLDMFHPYMDDPLVRLVSLMDHTPGQRQWTDLTKWRLYHEKDGWTKEQYEEILERRTAMQAQYAEKHRAELVRLCRERGIPLASHDDTDLSHVLEGASQGVAVSEFPTTLAAAREAHKRGQAVVMGAPNLVRGGSHSGNVSARELAQEGVLDILSSDYAPKSLLHGAFMLHLNLQMPLPQAVATVTGNVAEMLGLKDRGEIALGKRADLVRVHVEDGVPVVRAVWRQGMRRI